MSLLRYFPPRQRIFFERKKKKMFYQIIDNRSDYSLTHLQKLSEDIEHNIFNPYDLLYSNAYYGNSYILKKYCGHEYDKLLKVSIQHGLYFGKQFFEPELNSFPIVLVWGKQTFTNLKGFTSNKLIPIGSPFYYSTKLFADNLAEAEKTKLGKNLLVFPAHSTQISELSFDIDTFIIKIKEVGKDFQTIRVCLYWKDCKTEIIEKYSSHEIECVTAGHIYDYNFYPRLKSLIEISDATASNSIGSYIGYSINMNKPHVYIKSEVQLSTDIDGNRKRQFSKFEEDPNHNKLIKLLAESDFKINDEIKELVNLYWGYSEVKSKNELIQIFDEAESMFNKRLKRKWFYIIS